jgi:hypothetical protein
MEADAWVLPSLIDERYCSLIWTTENQDPFEGVSVFVARREDRRIIRMLRVRVREGLVMGDGGDG